MTYFPLSILGAELHSAHRYSPTRVALHLLPPFPASPTLHSHRQQHPAHHERIKVSPACPGLHRLLGGTRWTCSLFRKQITFTEYVDYLITISVVRDYRLTVTLRMKKFKGPVCSF